MIQEDFGTKSFRPPSQKRSDEKISWDQEKLEEEIRRNKHLTALAQLHSSHARGDKIAIWKESREIIDHFYSHVCEKINGKYRN